MNNCCKNTDKEIWRQTHEDYYSPSIHVTEQGAIGINCGGHVIVATVQEWHNWGKEALLDAVDHAAPAEPPKPTGEQLKAVGKVLAGDEPEPVVHYSCEGCGRKIIDEAFCRIGHLCCGRKRGHLRRNYTPKQPEPAEQVTNWEYGEGGLKQKPAPSTVCESRTDAGLVKYPIKIWEKWWWVVIAEDNEITLSTAIDRTDFDHIELKSGATVTTLSAFAENDPPVRAWFRK